MDSDTFHEYNEKNASEVEALVEIGTLDATTARRVLNSLRDRFAELQHMSVTDRVDLARDLAAL